MMNPDIFPAFTKSPAKGIRISVILCLAAFVCFAANCGSKRQQANPAVEHEIYTPKHAKGFALFGNGDTIVLKVTNPWQFADNIEFNYILTPNASPNARNEIKTPITKAICMSTTHVAFISALEKVSSIVGVSGLKHVSDSAVVAMGKENRVVDVGYDSNLSYELIFSIAPDVVFAYGVQGEFAAVEKRLNDLGIKVVYFGEYMENTPLGKAEWIVAMSVFFGDLHNAKMAFDRIESDYNDARKLSENVAEKPKVMFNISYGDTWYMPGTDSYMVKFVSDAGAEYIYPDNSGRNSWPMNIEKAFDIARNADFWLIGNESKSLDELKNTDHRMAEIPAFKRKRIFNSNLRSNGYGDDFWESGIVNPDIILKDLIKIFHPQIIPDHDFFYYRHLN
jgi:iron complex transport system substrate-binding protein